MTVDATDSEVASQWLPFGALTGAEPGALPMYCLPHAGGAASAFRAWQQKVPGVAVQPVQLPGRESRHREPPYETMPELVSDLADVVIADVEAFAAGRRYAVYGHSLGALTAFELVREIRRRGGPEPVHLFVSGSDPPHLSIEKCDVPMRERSRDGVAGLLRSLGGTPDWLLNDPEALDMILPAVRSDFTIKESYTYQDEAPIAVPVSVLSSDSDPRAAEDKVPAWRDYTTGAFALHAFTGGHFAVFEQATRTHQIVAEALAPWV